MKKLFALGLVLLVTLALAQQKSQSWIIPILGKPRASVEKVLGKPTSFQGQKVVAEGNYARKGLTKINVLYVDGKMAAIIAQFSTQPKNWQDALRRVNISTKGVEADPELLADTAGCFTYKFSGIAGVPKGWIAFFDDFVPKKKSGFERDIPARLVFTSPETRWDLMIEPPKE